MLNTLIASRARRQRSVTAQATSLVVHAALIAAAVVATHQVATAPPEELVHRVTFVPMPVAPEPVVTSPIGLVQGFRLLVAPIVIPDVLPKIDISQPLTDPNDYLRAVGVPGGGARGVVPDSVGAMREGDVDVRAALVPGSASPVYPEQLRAAGLQGDVQATFVIDTTGRADMKTFRIVASTHARFSESATRAVASARFVPAQLGGHKVRQWVLMPFVFSIR